MLDVEDGVDVVVTVLDVEDGVDVVVVDAPDDFTVVVVAGATVVVVDGVTAVWTIAVTVDLEGGAGVTPLGRKAMVTRMYCENLIVLGSVVTVGFVWASEDQ